MNETKIQRNAATGADRERREAEWDKIRAEWYEITGKLDDLYKTKIEIEAEWSRIEKERVKIEAEHYRIETERAKTEAERYLNQVRLAEFYEKYKDVLLP